MKKFKILYIDLDDTLIKTHTKKKFPQGVWDMDLRFDVFEKIKELEPEYVFIVSNQGGIGTYVNESDFNKKLDYIETSLATYIKHPKLKMVQSMYCPSNDKDDKYRKPNVGMLHYFFNQYLSQSYTKEDMLMVGDASGKEGQFDSSDLKTALNYGITYLDVEDFIRITFF